jgi:hypothetical protein
MAYNKKSRTGNHILVFLGSWGCVKEKKKGIKREGKN